MPDALRRPWCARIQFGDRAALLFGTVWTERNEGEERARTLIDAQLGRRFASRPAILALVPGALVFAPADGPA